MWRAAARSFLDHQGGYYTAIGTDLHDGLDHAIACAGSGCQHGADAQARNELSCESMHTGSVDGMLELTGCVVEPRAEPGEVTASDIELETRRGIDVLEGDREMSEARAGCEAGREGAGMKVEAATLGEESELRDPSLSLTAFPAAVSER
jgi:hypothetical protein